MYFFCSTALQSPGKPREFVLLVVVSVSSSNSSGSYP